MTLCQNGNRIIRNNVDVPVIVSEDKDYYKVESINDRNMNKLGIIETYNIPFEIELEDDGNSQLKCVLKVYNKPHECVLVDDLSVVCIVEEVEFRKYDEIRDYNVHLFRQSVLESINRLSCEYVGVVIVAEWADGGSDAMTLPLYSATDFHREFPDVAELSQVLDFYKGKGDGFIVRKWKDDNGRDVTDKVFYPSDTQVLREISEGVTDKIKVYIDDDEKFLEISMNIRHFNTLGKDGKKQD